MAAAFAALHGRRSPTVLPGGRKQFVCLCEDVTVKELAQGVEEGFDSLETAEALQHRHDGPCQGKSATASRRASTAADPGRVARSRPALTTSRPPVQPVSARASLAGPHLGARPAHRDARAARRAGRDVDGHGRLEAPAPLRRRRRRSVRAVHEARRAHRRLDARQARRPGPRRGRVPRLAPPEPVQRPRRSAASATARCSTTRGSSSTTATVARLGEDRFFVSTTTGNLDAVDQWLRWWLAGVRPARRRDQRHRRSYAAMNLAGPRSRESPGPAHRPRRVPRGHAVPRARSRAWSPASRRSSCASGSWASWATRSTSRPTRAAHLWDALMDAGARCGHPAVRRGGAARPAAREAARDRRPGHGRAVRTRRGAAWAG